jgi:hypothetical protein
MSARGPETPERNVLRAAGGYGRTLGRAELIEAMRLRAIPAVSFGMSSIVFARLKSRRNNFATRPLLNGIFAVSNALSTRLHS